MTRASDTARLLGAGGVINDDSNNVDFRIESNDDANMLFVDGGANAIGIRTSTDYGGQLNIETTGQAYNLVLACTDADANNGPLLDFYRNSSSPADNDLLGEISFRGRNDNSQDVNYGLISGTIIDASDGTEDGMLAISTMIAGTTRSRAKFTNDGTVFNEDSVDLDFRVESNNYAHTLFVQGGSGKVGIGDSSPNSYNNYASNLVINNGGDSNGHVGMTIACATDKIGSIYFADGTSGSAAYRGAIYYSHSSDDMRFLTSSAERVRIFSGGEVGIADGTAPENAAMLDVKRNSGDVVYFRNNGGTGAKLTAGNQSFSAVSDENKKENITELDKQQSYDNIKNIRAVTYKFKDIEITDDDGKKTTYEDDKSRIGFISQDWETKYSQLVSTDDNGVKSLLYTETTPVLLSALQKAQEKIEAQETNINDLQKRITALESA